jgi:hypothetical protein
MEKRANYDVDLLYVEKKERCHKISENVSF